MWKINLLLFITAFLLLFGVTVYSAWESDAYKTELIVGDRGEITLRYYYK